MRSPLTIFFIKVGLIYGGWEVLYQYVFLPDFWLDTWLSHAGVSLAAGSLSFLGWDIESTARFVCVVGNRGIEVQNGCNGLDLLGLYTGFIIAYPGETKKDFDETMKLVKKIKFINSYSFIFSPRPGTPAATKKLNKSIENEIRLKKLQKILENFQYKNSWECDVGLPPILIHTDKSQLLFMKQHNKQQLHFFCLLLSSF